ncbi:MAG TPA: NifB/NifX family molybdenum-iron cluster-binding protein [Desulfitobacteriaceae bacterium]|nr:NifB/NifX family molybdenum-iron cluster-binding protein [Desulfitobacteriaceae bacterium]
MVYKVAVASTDGKFVNEHFGRATQFLIFEVDQGQFRFRELVKTGPYCNQGEHDDHKLRTVTEILQGCRAVLVSQIGNAAAEVLKEQGIVPFEIRDFIEDAIPKLITYYDKFQE